MEIPIRILHIDDSYLDGGAVEAELERRQFPSSVRFVTKKADYLDALGRQDFDLLLLDVHMLPEFEAERAFESARSRNSVIPLILLASIEQQEDAIKALKNGASDYVLKDNLSRLVPSIERALADARRLNQAAEAEQKLRRLNDKLLHVQRELMESTRVQEETRVSGEKYRRMFDAMTEAAAVFELVYDASRAPVDCIFRDMNPAFELLIGAKRAEHLGKHASEFFGEVLRLDLFHRVAATGQPGSFEAYATSLGKFIVVSAVPVDQQTVAVIITDITERKEMEEALLKNQHRLSLTQEAGNLGVFDWNIVTGQVIWTPELARLLGASARQHRYTFEEWSQLIHADDRSRVERMIRDWLVSDRNEERTDYRIARADGEIRWIELSGRLVRDAGGRPLRMIGTNLDITERKRVEEELQKSHERVKQVLESIHDAFYSLDRDWKFTYVNRRACELWKKRADELIGQVIWDLFPSGRDTGAYEAMQRVLKTGQEETFEAFSSYLETWTTVRVYSTDEGIAVYFLDITYRKKAEASLQRSEQLYRAIGETINWGIWVCDPDGKNIYASPSFLAMVGLTQEECSEFGWGSVLHPDDADATIAAWKECTRTGSFWERAHRFRGVDGKYHHVLARGIPVRDEQGVITCWAGINLDIDEMMEREEEMEQRVEQRTKQLVRVNQELESFSYTVSHDLKAPLRVINGFANLLLNGQASHLSTQEREYLQLIIENTDRMNELVNALLTFSRVTRQVAHMTLVDVGSVVKSVVEQEKHAAAGQQGAHSVDIEIGDLPNVVADPVLLRQVFANLISNALKFTRTVPEPSIQVSACIENDMVVYSVQDNGVGFTSEEAKKLFQVFQRLHSQKEFEGSGVGLANVRKIIERHGGKVWAEGEPGKGATFYVALPRQSYESSSAIHSSTSL
jgi:PAS domain S-box-containing protein